MVACGTPAAATPKPPRSSSASVHAFASATGGTAGASSGPLPGIRTRLRFWRIFFAASVPLPAAAIAVSRYPEDDWYRSSASASTFRVDSRSWRFRFTCARPPNG